MSELIYLRPDRLRTHPHNMRRYYPPADVAEMAASIRAAGGVLQALLVVPDPDLSSAEAHNGTAGDAHYLAVDGNMRLAGAHQLGAECPDLKCEVITADHASQLLIMATTSAVHYPKDPIAEALHYQRLQDEGYSVNEISLHTGIAWTQIRGRLRWLELETEIQEHAAAGRLPRDHRVAEALAAIPDTVARVKLADRLAAAGATIAAIQRACAKLVESLQIQAAARETQTPALAHSNTVHQAGPASWQGLRIAAHHACQLCDVRQQNLATVAEPAWEAITHAAGDTCAACNLRDIQTLCSQCPVVELLRRLKEPALEATATHSQSLQLTARGGHDVRASR